MISVMTISISYSNYIVKIIEVSFHLICCFSYSLWISRQVTNYAKRTKGYDVFGELYATTAITTVTIPTRKSAMAPFNVVTATTKRAAKAETSKALSSVSLAVWVWCKMGQSLSSNNKIKHDQNKKVKILVGSSASTLKRIQMSMVLQIHLSLFLIIVILYRIFSHSTFVRR